MFKYADYEKSANYIKQKIEGRNPKTVIVLGSGLGVLSDEIKDKIVLKYADLPNFPASTVEGHAGELIIGKLGDKEIIAMNGRFHYYEGYDFKEVTFPIRVFKLLGVETLILTNAAGGINTSYKPGEFMVIDDHLTLFAESVLRGPNIDQFGERFIDASGIYNKEYNKKMAEVIKRVTGVSHVGVYAYMKGPQFETPAEIRALRILGADAVGMSTVPEAIIAHHCGIKTVAVSCITNMAAGILDRKLSHQEVKETADRVKLTFKQIVKEFIEEL